MKSFTTLSAFMTTLVGVTTAQQGQVKLEVRYSDNMIDVGNVDLFAVTWQSIYDATGSISSVLTDNETPAENSACKNRDESQNGVNVRVKINGAWGSVAGVGASAMRDALVASLWEVLQEASNPYAYEVLTGCQYAAFTGFKFRTDANCGPEASRSCEGLCKGIAPEPQLVQCDGSTWGHKVPATMRVLAYVDGALQPDDLIVEFSTTSPEAEAGGCGLTGQIASTLLGFIPHTGGLFATGLDILCAE